MILNKKLYIIIIILEINNTLNKTIKKINNIQNEKYNEINN